MMREIRFTEEECAYIYYCIGLAFSGLTDDQKEIVISVMNKISDSPR